jgi:hypothetical protein
MTKLTVTIFNFANPPKKLGSFGKRLPTKRKALKSKKNFKNPRNPKEIVITLIDTSSVNVNLLAAPQLTVRPQSSLRTQTRMNLVTDPIKF